VRTTDTICNCGENAERQVRRFSQRVQWTPLLRVISIFVCENTHSVAVGLLFTAQLVLDNYLELNQTTR